MKKLTCLLAVVACVLTIGCARKVYKNWAATGGSRADAVVRLSYQYTNLEIPQVNDAEAQKLAEKKCQSWGYSGAEAFGASIVHCLQIGYYGDCMNSLVTKEFQCIGQGTELPHQ